MGVASSFHSAKCSQSEYSGFSVLGDPFDSEIYAQCLKARSCLPFVYLKIVATRNKERKIISAGMIQPLGRLIVPTGKSESILSVTPLVEDDLWSSADISVKSCTFPEFV